MESSAELRRLLYRIYGDTSRQLSLPLSGSFLEIPCYFPSISSLKANLLPIDYLRFLVKVRARNILISAYDVVHSKPETTRRIIALLRKARKQGSRVMIDCGNYESFWKKDLTWTSRRYYRIIKLLPHHLATIFDDHDQINGNTRNIKLIEKETKRLEELQLQSVVVPIIHASQARIIRVAKAVANRLRPLLVAMPERELGNGIIERVTTLVQIRRELNRLGTYIPIHLLGTGNPLSLLLFSVFGADSYDGLEWCQTTVRPHDALLLHYHQRELLGKAITKRNGSGATYQIATLLHNIKFYERWMQEIRDSLRNDSANELLESYFKREFLDQLKGSIKRVI